MRGCLLVCVGTCTLACFFQPQGTADGETSSTTGESSTSSSSSTGVTPTSSETGGLCTPGTVAACACPEGLQSVKACNDNGTAYGPCICPGSTTTGTTSTSTTAVDPSTTTTSDDTTTTSDDTTTTAADTTTSDDTTTTSDDTTGGGEPYGPCMTSDDCLPNDICVTGMVNGISWSLCTSDPCATDADCTATPDNACADAPGDGVNQLYCVPQLCNVPDLCPTGMACFQGINGNPNVCLWPP